MQKRLGGFPPQLPCHWALGTVGIPKELLRIGWEWTRVSLGLWQSFLAGTESSDRERPVKSGGSRFSQGQ